MAGGVEAATGAGAGAPVEGGAGGVAIGVLGRRVAGIGVPGGVGVAAGGGVAVATAVGVAVGSGVLLGTPPTAFEPPPDGVVTGDGLVEAEPAGFPWYWSPAAMQTMATTRRTAPAT